MKKTGTCVLRDANGQIRVLARYEDPFWNRVEYRPIPVDVIVLSDGHAPRWRGYGAALIVWAVREWSGPVMSFLFALIDD